MRSILNLSMVMLVALFFTACGSSNYNYHVNPTPIKEGTSKFKLNKFEFKLDDSDRNESSNFMLQNQMKKLFEASITRQMKENDILGQENGFLIDLKMEYVRNYYYMGNGKDRDSIQLPYFKYTYNVYDTNNKLLATYSIPQSVIDYGSMSMVNFQIIAFARKAKHEIEDINHISKYLVKTFTQLGE